MYDLPKTTKPKALLCIAQLMLQIMRNKLSVNDVAPLLVVFYLIFISEDIQ